VACAAFVSPAAFASPPYLQTANSPLYARSPGSTAFSPDGTLLAITGSGAGDSPSVSVYAVGPDGAANGSPISSSPAGQRAVSAVFSPDGRLLATAQLRVPRAYGFEPVGYEPGHWLPIARVSNLQTRR
jgi:Tol biopolymer transport system component